MTPRPPEYRQDPVTGAWVILSSERALRPHSAASEGLPEPPTGAAAGIDADCPFCRGNEHQTPPAVATWAAEDARQGSLDAWAIRVVPNRYPAVRETLPPSPPLEPLPAAGPDGPHCVPGFGYHEVIIESPHHVWSVSRESPGHLAALFRTYRERLRTLGAMPGVRAVQIFKNAGRPAGASQEHVHAQVIALPFVPPIVAAEVAGAAEYYRRHGHKLFPHLIQRELDAKVRIVEETDRFVAWCPYASRFAGEMWLAPKEAGPSYTECEEGALGELGALAGRLMIRLEARIRPAAYNYFLHSVPVESALAETYHWHWEFTPRGAGLAGFEIGGGTYLNTVAPKDAAAMLRSVPLETTDRQG